MVVGRFLRFDNKTLAPFNLNSQNEEERKAQIDQEEYKGNENEMSYRDSFTLTKDRFLILAL